MEDKKEVKKMEAEAPEALDTEELDQVTGGVQVKSHVQKKLNLKKS